VSNDGLGLVVVTVLVLNDVKRRRTRHEPIERKKERKWTPQYRRICYDITLYKSQLGHCGVDFFNLKPDFDSGTFSVLI
jgi:hypothetical protein